MSPTLGVEPDLPALQALGNDLLVTTPLQRRLALARPFLGVAAYALAAYAGLWWLTPFLVFLVFVAVVTVTHDVVHGSLGLSPRQTHWALFGLGAVLLESGHAYRATHLQHHRVFPGPDDPEGDPARLSLVQAVLWGPLFLPRLWCWALARSRPGSMQRRWLIAEAAWALAVPVAGLWLLRWTPGVAVYALLAFVGSWVYPLLTVHLPHRNYGETPLTQTHTLRGRIVPALFLELTYHLEHHLYPEVPSHNLPHLSRRLDPVLREAGVQPRRVP
jgi:beta-carotene hydroxylase